LAHVGDGPKETAMAEHAELMTCYALLDKQMSNIARQLEEILLKHRGGPLARLSAEPTDPVVLGARHLVREKIQEALAKMRIVQDLVGGADPPPSSQS
jgi:hypothetical protein